MLLFSLGINRDFCKDFSSEYVKYLVNWNFSDVLNHCQGGIEGAEHLKFRRGEANNVNLFC